MKSVKKRVLSVLLLAGFTMTNLASGIKVVSAHENDKVNDKVNVIADWKFDSSNIESGSIADKNLVLKDLSGNGNNLRMNTYGNVDDYSKYINFSDEKMYDDAKGSIVINGDSEKKVGADLLTVDNAPINKEKFENGYTIEFIYKLPSDWTAADSWMSILSRQGDCTSMDEPELGTMNVAVSNCKEIQFLTANKDDNHKMDSASWSVSMDKGGVWYHIAIVNDNKSIRTFVNGAESFRDYVGDDMVGLYADPKDGRFRIGSSYWKKDNQTLDKFARGNYQEIKISEGALDKSQWIISNPEKFIGEYGNNNDFSLKSQSNYNMVFLPDTQNTIKFKKNVMDTAMNWLVDNKDKTNLVSVTHLGDIVEDGNNDEQWNNAMLFNKLPKNNIHLLMQPGNHDWPDYFDRYFGKDSEYAKLSKDYLVRTSPSGRSSYMINDGGSYKYMTLSVDYHSFDSDLPWVEEVLSKTNIPTIITSHDLENCSDSKPNYIKLSKKGKEVWDVVKKYNQVFMMIGGHSHGAGDQILINDAGNEVFNILADYQFAYNGGNAFFKFAEFDENANKIYLSTFSPYAATLGKDQRTFFDVNYLTGEGNYSEFNINFAKRFAGMEKSNSINSNLEQLKSLVEKAEALNKDEYTTDSFNAVSEALNKAKAVLMDQNANYNVVLDAVQTLQNAMDNLKKIEDEPSNDKENNNSYDNQENNKQESNKDNSVEKNSNKNLPKTGDTNSLIYILPLVTIALYMGVKYRK